MLPEPTLTFTLPSLHDGTVLKCRVYHPWSLSPSPKAPPWRHDAAIVAHPYAPLGGSYDDAIVGLVATTLLKAGFLVATFNFRGAAGSAGRTSWTAKAERGDYMSVAGFLALYAQILDPFRHSPSQPATPVRSGFSSPRLPRSPPPAWPHAAPRSQSDDSSSSPPGPAEPAAAAAAPLLVFSGYSYGALVTSQLPRLSEVLVPFLAPEHGTPAAEIRLRAENLAATQNEILRAARRAAEREATAARGGGGGTPQTSPRKSLSLRVGGEEDMGHHGSRRKSHDSYRSLRASIDDAEDKLRRGVSDLLAKTRHYSPPRRSTSLHGVPGQRQHTLRAVSSPDPSRRGDVSPVIKEAEDEDEGEHGGAEQEAAQNLPTLVNPPSPAPAYLLVSPPLSIAGNLTSLSFSLPSLPKRLTRRASVPPASGAGGEGQHNNPLFGAPQRAATEALGVAADSTSPVGGNLALDSLSEADRKMVENPTLVVYGDSDVFVSNRRMRGWAARLQAVSGSRFRAHEVSTAGHFWQEGPAEGESVAHVLHHAVRTFADGLLQGRAHRW